MNAVTTLGFDPDADRFVGTWVGSPMATMFIYEGRRDAGGTVLTLDCQGPGFEDPTQLADYQDIIELASPNERRFASQLKRPDGSWHRFLNGVFRRER